MTYAIRSDLETRFGAEEFAQREALLGAGAVDLALLDATAEIDGYIDNRYVTPLSPVPDIIAKRCCDIARYNLLGDACTEDARKRYTDAVNFLQDIQQGNLNLDGAQAKVGGSPATRVEMTSRRKIFGRPF